MEGVSVRSDETLFAQLLFCSSATVMEIKLSLKPKERRAKLGNSPLLAPMTGLVLLRHFSMPTRPSEQLNMPAIFLMFRFIAARTHRPFKKSAEAGHVLAYDGGVSYSDGL